MYIEELNIKTKDKFVTITLDYDELRWLNNALYHLSKLNNIEQDENFNKVYAEIIELFALIKNGMIPNFDLEAIYKLLKLENK